MNATGSITIDGDAAPACIAYLASEGRASYPITPSSPMGVFADPWAREGRPNLWSVPPHVVAMLREQPWRR
jgi:pyruvate-ferredoxin/flavodoxin oxidoreductase